MMTGRSLRVGEAVLVGSPGWIPATTLLFLPAESICCEDGVAAVGFE